MMSGKNARTKFFCAKSKTSCLTLIQLNRCKMETREVSMLQALILSSQLTGRLHSAFHWIDGGCAAIGSNVFPNGNRFVLSSCNRLSPGAKSEIFSLLGHGPSSHAAAGCYRRIAPSFPQYSSNNRKQGGTP
jgi:hypothetical protein